MKNQQHLMEQKKTQLLPENPTAHCVAYEWSWNFSSSSKLMATYPTLVSAVKTLTWKITQKE